MEENSYSFTADRSLAGSLHCATPPLAGQLVIGPATIDLKTGEVVLAEGTNLSESALEFWDAIQAAFKDRRLIPIPRETVENLVRFDGIDLLRQYL